MQLDDLLDERQPDAAALMRPAPGVFNAMEPLEKPGELFGGNAGTGVPHSKLDAKRTWLIVTAISPSKVNLKALETRLRTTFSHMPRST